MKLRKVILMILISISCFVFIGCWDGVEIDRRSIIFSVGIDKVTDRGDPDDIDYPNRYLISYPIPDMGKLTGNDSISEDVVSVETAESQTFLSSIEQVQTRTQDTMNFGHTKAIILGEDILEDSTMMKEIIDSLERNMLFSRSIPMFAVRDTAYSVANVDNKQHPIIGLYIMNYVNNSERDSSRHKEALLGNVIRELREENTAVIPIIEITEDENIEISGGALLKDFKLETWLTPEEIRGILWIDGKVKGATLPIDINDKYLSYKVSKQDSKIKFSFDEDDTLYCKINIINEGEIGEYYIQSDSQLTELEYIRNIEERISKVIQKEIEDVLSKTKKHKTDTSGLGQELYRRHPKIGKKLLENWDDIYKDMEIEINVDTKIRRTGIIE